jgi:hypothetical protein
MVCAGPSTWSSTRPAQGRSEDYTYGPLIQTPSTVGASAEAGGIIPVQGLDAIEERTTVIIRATASRPGEGNAEKKGVIDRRRYVSEGGARPFGDQDARRAGLPDRHRGMTPSTPEGERPCGLRRRPRQRRQQTRGAGRLPAMEKVCVSSPSTTQSPDA